MFMGDRDLSLSLSLSQPRQRPTNPGRRQLRSSLPLLPTAQQIPPSPLMK